MIKLKEIKIKGVCHANVFYEMKELELVDMVLYMDYKIDRETFDITKYAISEDDLEYETLEEIFASFILVSLEGDSYKKIDTMNYDELKYVPVSDACSDVENTEQKISEKEQKKAFKLIKKYVKSDIFKKELDQALNYELSR